jgi:acyl-CoA synthetase (AMP-forming)/AMP-acid ligase II
LAGGVAVPVNHRYRQRELGPLITAYEPRAVFADEETMETANQAIEQAGRAARLLRVGSSELAPDSTFDPEPANQNDLAVILHTSGTTGIPKGVERTQGEYARFVLRWGGHAMRRDDRVLNFLPLYHQAGLVCAFLSAFVAGIPTFNLDRFNRETFWATVDSYALTWAILMQPVPRYLLDDADQEQGEPHALEWIVATVTPEDWIGFQDRFGVAVNSSYGSTETTIVRVTGSRGDGPVDGSRVHGPLGGALCGQAPEFWADLRIVTDDGQAAGIEQPGFIEVRGETVLKRYFRNPEATGDAIDSDGWFRTGDFGYVSSAGDIYFLDRVSGLIRRSGENIAPREIEELIEEHPKVAEAAVIGVPDALRGEEIAAFLVPRPGSSLAEAEIFSLCQEQLSHFKVPRYIELRTELPHTPTFKVRREALTLTAAAVDRLADESTPDSDAQAVFDVSGKETNAPR